VHAQPVELARQADGEVADIDHLLDLTQTLGEDLPHFQRHQPAQRVLELAQLFAQLPYDFAALRRGHHAPGAKRFVCRACHRLVVLGGGLPHGGDRLVQRGVVGHERRTAGLDPGSGAGSGVLGLDSQGFQ
jgi:hypothetical protein